jgi:hypothetical protein
MKIMNPMKNKLSELSYNSKRLAGFMLPETVRLSLLRVPVLASGLRRHEATPSRWLDALPARHLATSPVRPGRQKLEQHSPNRGGLHSPPFSLIFRQKYPLAWHPGLCFHAKVKRKTYVTEIINNRFAASAAVQSKTGNFDLQDTVRGTPPSGVPESVPVRAYQCLDWGASRSRLFELDTARRIHKKHH